MAPPYLDLFAWLEGQRAPSPSPAPSPPSARPCSPTRCSTRPSASKPTTSTHPCISPSRLRRRMEMGWRPRPARRRPGRPPPLHPQWRRHLEGLPRPPRSRQLQRRHRRRTPHPLARRRRRLLQRAAATPQPQDRLAEADGRTPRHAPRLRPAAGRRRRPPPAPLRRTPQAPRTLRRHARRPAHRPLPPRPLRPTPPALDDLRRNPPTREIEGLMLKRWDAPYVAGRPAGQWYKWKRDPLPRRRRADVRPARPRQTLRPLLRLHLRRLAHDGGRRRTHARRQGLFRLHRRRTGPARQIRPRQHASTASAPSAPSPPTRTQASSSRSPSKASSAPPATTPASPCASPASTASAGTNLSRDADRIETLEAMLPAELSN